MDVNPLAQAPHPSRSAPLQPRDRIKRCFNKLKHSRRFATRYARIQNHYLAFVYQTRAVHTSSRMRAAISALSCAKKRA